MTPKQAHGWVSRMEGLIADLEDRIATREDAYNGRSEKWQDGDAGELHRDRTNKLQAILDQAGEFLAACEDLASEED